MLPFILELPTTIEEVISILNENINESVMVKAGGTDLIPWMNKYLVHPQRVVDLCNIPSLSILEYRPETGLRIGALVSVNAVANFPSVSEFFPAIKDACRSHSDQIIRNKATVVGNVCAAVPSADMVPALLAHDASVHVIGSRGESYIPLADFIVGPRKTILNKDEIVTSITVPTPKSISCGCYLKLGRRNALDLAQVGVSCVITDMPGNPQYHIACGAVAPRVLRITKAEAMLNGVKKPDADLLDKVARIAMDTVSPISDVRASMEYRLDQVGEMVKRAILKCIVDNQ